MADNSPITAFRGAYAFLSNMFPVFIEMDGQIYAAVEDAFQAAKTVDPAERESIRCSRTSKEAKARGRHVTLIPGWDTKRVEVMRSLVYKKFQQPELRNRLLATGNRALIEGNTWGDTFWGVCNGVGDNHLGKILMEVRAAAREEISHE